MKYHREPTKECYNAVMEFALDGDVEKIRAFARRLFVGKCEWCGVEFHRGRHVGRKYCSEKCQCAPTRLRTRLQLSEKRAAQRLEISQEKLRRIRARLKKSQQRIAQSAGVSAPMLGGADPRATATGILDLERSRWRGKS